MNVSAMIKLLTGVLFAGLLTLASLGVSAQEVTTVNLNTASSFKLMKLPYMGRSLARAIVDFRNENGPFKAPEDLLAVPGMNEETLAELNVQVDSNGDVVASYSEAGDTGMEIPNY